jgi:hypothetical protein
MITVIIDALNLAYAGSINEKNNKKELAAIDSGDRFVVISRQCACWDRYASVISG